MLSVNFMLKTAYILLVKLMRVFKIAKISEILPKILFAFSVCLLLLFCSKQSAEGALNGLRFCVEVLVPSLFPFMVLSSFTVKSGICSYFEKPLGKITRVLFGLCGSCGTTIFLSLVGGFPVGARGISTLYREKIIGEKQAEQMAYFAVCSGPGFLITFVGMSLFKSPKIGLLLFCASAIVVVVLGLFSRFFVAKDENAFEAERQKKIALPLSNAITEAASDGSKACIDMCAMVVIFSSFIAICDYYLSGLPELEKCCYVLLEVTSACNELCGSVKIEVIAFAVGFGGLCVHFQIFQALGDIKFSKCKFFIFRIVQGIFTAVTAKILFYFFPVEEVVFLNYQSCDNNGWLSSSVPGSIMLIITAICFLCSLRNYNKCGG